ncbi:alpha/beta hydrolase [Aureimonas frigidaquae]|uniref:alpha/beta hydrolase n=1 Tax=Aureimonas frigidaquae TaxID=424757 RepID=UPI0007846A62|nr:alpha/beta hydrolase-fold protein [Aureimonas frigidaquae]
MSRPLPTGQLPGPSYYDLQGADAGAPWRIFVHVPAGDPPPHGWPLLVTTDGNAMIDTAIAAAEVQASYPKGTNVEPGVIASIGYPTEGRYDPLRRSFDLSPPPGRQYPPFVDGGPIVRTGGADRFHAFIEDGLLPFLDTIAPLDRNRRTLFGHSFGGLFALHVLFAGSDAFRAYVAASPTIYWEDGNLLERENAYLAAGTPPRTITVRLSAGAYEDLALAPFQERQANREERLANLQLARTAGLARDMALRLAAAGMDAEFESHAAETHMTVLPVAISRAVGVAFARRPEPTLGQGSEQNGA